MANCYVYGTYFPDFVSRSTLGSVSVTVWGGEDVFQQYRDDLQGGATCETVKADYQDCIDFQCWTEIYAEPGTAIPKPTSGSVGWTNPGSPTSGNANYGVTIKVVAYTYPDFTPINRGKLNLAAVITTLGTCPGPTASYQYEDDDQFTGSWPIILATDPQPGDIIGVSISKSLYEGGLVPAEGFVDCGGGNSVLYGDAIAYPDEVTVRIDFNNLGGFTDTEAQWCCISEGFGCCATPGGNFAPRFLIPTPLTPQPGEEKVTTPLLYTPLYLANHTFQFVSNFGRVKK